MDNSTEGVALLAAFIYDVLKEFEGQESVYPDLFEIVKDIDKNSPYSYVPMSVFNNLCQWVQDNIGADILIKIGTNVGETAYGALIENSLIEDGASPEEIMDGLSIAAGSMIQDPKDRGWELLNEKDKSLIMRKTQTFNSKLQFGVLSGLMKKSGKNGVNVSYAKEVAEGDEFDDYLISWEN